MRSPALHACALLLSMAPLLLGCPGDSGGNPDAGGDPDAAVDGGSIFPEDFQATFTEVRGCRNSIDHAAFIRIWADPTSAAGYQAGASPLPAGSMVVKEEFVDAACTDLIAHTAMRKEPGLDPANGDWRWERRCGDGSPSCVNQLGAIPSGCVACHISCANDANAQNHLERDFMCASP